VWSTIEPTAHHVHTVQVEANHNSFDSFIANMRPDYVLFDRFVMVSDV